MRRYLLTLVCVCAAVGALGASSSSSMAWRHFKSEHAKVYGPEEDSIRFANFLATKQLVECHNTNPNATFKMGLNHMADWTREERQKLTGTKLSGTQKREGGDSFNPKLAKLLDGLVPKEVDWRKVPKRVSAVKDQGNCSSAWAFAATGVLEGQQAPLGMTGFIPLSEQVLLDCSKMNQGCSGGSPGLALTDLFYHIITVESEADYPYEAQVGICRTDESNSIMIALAGYYLKKGEATLLDYVANYGPVAVSIQATDNFIHYSSGVFDDPSCPKDNPDVNHHALVVGYGTDPKGGDYWLIKNSWGTKWGDEGYMKMKRGVNMCGIGDLAVIGL